MLFALLAGCAVVPGARAEVAPGWSTVECGKAGTEFTADLGDPEMVPVQAWTGSGNAWRTAEKINFDDGVLTVFPSNAGHTECLVYVAD